MKSKIIALLSFLFACTSMLGQGLELDFNPITIPSPNVASLGIFGEIPVDYHTGVPNISVPIHTIQEGNLSVPIVIKYHASGFNPKQYPSWVGLGWALQAGGVINRKVNKLPDENDGYINGIIEGTGSYHGYYYNTNLLAGDDWLIFNDSPGIEDTEPDEFSFHVNGISGKFYLDHNKEWQVFSEQEIKVIFDEADIVSINKDYFYLDKYQTPFSHGQMFYKFTLVGPDGTKYIFGGNRNAIEFTRPENPYDNTKVPTATSWNLVKIISSDGNDYITFDYSRQANDLILYTYLTANINAFSNSGVTEYYGNGQVPSSRIIEPSYLKSITSKHQKIIFIAPNKANALPIDLVGADSDIMELYEENYEDIKLKESNGGTPKGFYSTSDLSNVGRQLDKIVINYYDRSNDQVGGLYKEFIFSYTENNTERLKLKSLTESISNIDNIFELDYYSTTIDLPDYYTKMVDHWGYFNYNEPVLPAKAIDILTSQEALDDYYDSRNPSVDTNIYLANTLKKITYPTGGYTLFEFEPHDYSEYIKRIPRLKDSKIAGLNTMSLKQLNTKPKAGGLRVKRVKSNTGNTSTDIVKEYFYVKNFNSSDNTTSVQTKLSTGQLQTELPQKPDQVCLDQKAQCQTEYNLFHQQCLAENHMDPEGYDECMIYAPDCSNYDCFDDAVSPYSKKGIYLEFDESLGYFNIFISNPILPLSNSNGNHVVYNSVSEKRSDGSYTTYSYTLPDIHTTRYQDETPVSSRNNDFFAKLTSNIIERGKISSVKTYNSINELVKRIDYNYISDPDRENKGIRTRKHYIHQVSNELDRIFGVANYIYYFNSHLENKTETTFLDGNAVTETTTYTYGGLNDKLLKEIELDKSDGSEWITRYYYTTDYNIDAYINNTNQNNYEICLGRNQECMQVVTDCEQACFDQYHTNESRYNECMTTCPIADDCNFYFDCSNIGGGEYTLSENGQALYDMQSMHIIEPVEKLVYKKENGIEENVEGKLFTYKKYSDFVIKPDKIYNLELYYPINQKPVTPAFVNSLGKFVFNYCYNEKVSFNEYDNSGNLLEYQKKDDIPVTMLYGYNKSFPIAKFTGLTYTQLTTGLESASISMNSLQNNDEIYNIFPDALIETYTYDVLKGITSIKDPLKRTTSYDYDPMGRLRMVTDHRGNILEHNKYFYKGQEEFDDVLQYLIVSETGYNGIIEPTDMVINEGENASFSIIPNDGYVINAIQVNNEDFEIDTILTFDNVNESKVISVDFEFDPIKIAKSGSGSISLDGTTTIAYGNDITYNFTPSTEYYIKDVVVDGESVVNSSNYTFENVTGAHTLHVEFSDMYRVSTTVIGGTGGKFSALLKIGANGTVTPTYTEIQYGGDLSVFVSADEGYYIYSITNDEIPVEGLTESTIGKTISYSNIDQHHGIDVEFRIKTFDISTSVSGNGTITASGTSSVDYGENRTYTFIPDANHHIKDIKVNGISQGTDNTLTIENIRADKNIEVEFEIDYYPITVTKSGSGTVSPSNIDVDHGGNISLNFIPTTGYYIKDVVVDGESVVTYTNYTFENVTGPHTFHVEFTNIYKVSTFILGNEGGTIIPANPEIEYGGSAIIRLSANEGYYIYSITNDEIPVEGLTESTIGKTISYSNIDQHHGIDVEFRIKTFDISTSVSGNGTITASGTSSVDYGENRTYTFIPDANHHIKDIKVNGISQGTDNTLTIENIRADKNIEVEFAINTYTITATKTGSGTMSPSGNSVVNYNGSKTYTFSPSTGRYIKNVKVKGVSKGGITSYTFSNVKSIQTISVEFALKTYLISTLARYGTGGSFSPSNPTVTYNSDVAITATASSGYYIYKVWVDEMPVTSFPSNRYIKTFKDVNKAHNIEVEFKHNPVTITATKSGSGTISPSGTTSVAYGGSKTYSFTPASGYYVKNVKVNGGSKGALNSKTFTNVTSDQTIWVDFALSPYLDLNKTGIPFTLSGGVSSFAISSNVSWTVSTSDTWLSISPVSGSNNATITVNCSAFRKFDRYGTISITGGGITKTVYVTQSNATD